MGYLDLFNSSLKYIDPPDVISIFQISLESEPHLISSIVLYSNLPSVHRDFADTFGGGSDSFSIPLVIKSQLVSNFNSRTAKIPALETPLTFHR